MHDVTLVEGRLDLSVEARAYHRHDLVDVSQSRRSEKVTVNNQHNMKINIFEAYAVFSIIFWRREGSTYMMTFLRSME